MLRGGGGGGGGQGEGVSELILKKITAVLDAISAGFITNQFNDLLPVGLFAQLVERCTGITEVKGSNPEQAFQAFFSQLQNLRLYNCDDLLSYY